MRFEIISIISIFLVWYVISTGLGFTPFTNETYSTTTEKTVLGEGSIKTWATVKADYFSPPKELISGYDISSKWVMHGDFLPTECKKSRIYGYNWWSAGPKVVGNCGGDILEFNTTNEAVECFDKTIQKFKEENVPMQSIFVKDQNVTNLTSSGIKTVWWTKNRFLFIIIYDNLECDKHRDIIINYITSKYPLI